jgi:ABC-type arginine transport system permease subunit
MYIVVGCIYLAFSTVITLSVMGMEKFGARTGEGAR